MISELESYALEHKIPIMQKDGILYLCEYIKKNNVKRILEIGSAIGYSAIMMGSVSDDIYITTIEKDVLRYNEACANVLKFGMDKRINVINMDAKEYVCEGKYDLIFIDASKGNNKYFFNRFKDNLNDDGVIITDNLAFHGLVMDSSLVKTKNQRGIVNKIKDYIDFLDNNLEFVTEYVSVGDKISISRRNL